MKIGVDCDGVLTDMSGYICQYGEAFFRRKPVNPAGYGARDIFGCSAKENLRFGLRYFPLYCRKWPPRPGAVEALGRLRAQGHRLYEITARMFVTKKSPLGWYSRRMFHTWIREHGFQFEDIYFCSEERSPEDKLAGCRQYGVDLMIDDKPEVALYLADNGMQVLLFDAPYNQETAHENLIRVYDWKDVERVIAALDGPRGRSGCFPAGPSA